MKHGGLSQGSPLSLASTRRGSASEVFAVIVQGPTRVGAIKKLCELKSQQWGVEIFPRPNKAPLASPQEEDDLLVGPTSTVVFSPRS